MFCVLTYILHRINYTQTNSPLLRIKPSKDWSVFANFGHFGNMVIFRILSVFSVLKMDNFGQNAKGDPLQKISKLAIFLAKL